MIELMKKSKLEESNNMKYFLLVALLILLTGCSNSPLAGEAPPTLQITVANESYEAKLGTYCWGNKCEDAVEPMALVETFIQVVAGESVELKMNKPTPSEVQLTELTADNKTMPIKIEQQHFVAPLKPGTYYYSYSAWWQEGDQTQGDAHYAFALEIK